MTLASKASPRERRTMAFFEEWSRITGFMTTEEMGAYAAISAQVSKSGAPMPDEHGRHIIHAQDGRPWRRLRDRLLALGAIEIMDDGSILVPVLKDRLYKTGYLYMKDAIPHRLRWRVFQRDGYQCMQCAGREDLTADHIIPEIKGGKTTLENLQTLCRPCNSRKWAYT